MTQIPDTHGPSGRLAGRVALVTGASRGIGRAAALALAREGADIVVNCRSSEREAREVCGQIERMGRRSIPVLADVSVATEVQGLVERSGQFGPITILVNNAGIARQQGIDEVRERDWDDVMAMNLKSVFLVTQAVLPMMRAARWGRIINLSSTAAQIGGVVGAHYAASKAGILGLTHFYAARLAGEGITANAIAPALIETDMVKGLSFDPARIPVGRLGTAAEVAQAIVMLASNGYMTGQTVSLNGGIYPT